MGLQIGLIPSQINEKKISINQFMFSNLTWILVFCQLYETVDATNASCIIGWQIAPNSPRWVSYLLVFPFVYQFNSRIGVLVNSSFAND